MPTLRHNLVIVLAGSYRQFEAFLSEVVRGAWSDRYPGARRSDFVFGESIWAMRGLRADDVLTIGSFGFGGSRDADLEAFARSLVREV